MDWTTIGYVIFAAPLCLIVWVTFCYMIGALASDDFRHPRSALIAVVVTNLWIGSVIFFLWLGGK